MQPFRLVLTSQGIAGLARDMHTVFQPESDSARDINSVDDKVNESTNPAFPPL